MKIKNGYNNMLYICAVVNNIKGTKALRINNGN